MRRYLFTLFLCLAALCSRPAFSRAVLGGITGSVVDASGVAVGGAGVIVRNVDTNLEVKATTQPNGSYQVLNLPIGNYSVSFSMYSDRGEYFLDFSPPDGPGALSGPFGVTLAQPFIQQVGTTANGTISEPFAGTALPAPVTSLAGIYSLIPNGAGLAAGKQGYLVYGYDAANKLPYTVNWTFDLQWQPTNSLQMSLGYVGNHGVHQVLPNPGGPAILIATASNPVNGQTVSYGYNVVPSLEPLKTYDGGNTDLPYDIYDYSGSVAGLYYANNDYLTNPVLPLKPAGSAHNQPRRDAAIVKWRYEANIKPAIGNLPAARFGASQVRAFVSARREAGVSDPTINRELSIIRRGFRLGFEEDPPIVRRVPHILKLDEDNARQGFLTPAQYETLLASLPERLKPLFAIA